ncbi:O-antigen ligase family protein [Pseudoalteromonas sp. T1lg48]|uniref:O-antigen ligase family protein n=1 Tax=Pseudoalteromonas sp. T1lg48 TaxID=2077100 RepID=UPI000CF70236|nr:O-antigen ligase family protein [Pseudoalteromonas sp. T1lg48]
MVININGKTSSFLIVVLFMSMLSNGIYYDVGFSVTLAYFVLPIVIFFIFLNGMRLSKFLFLSFVFVFFVYFCFFLSSFYSYNFDSSFRFFFGALAFLFFFFSFSSYLVSANKDIYLLLGVSLKVYLVLTLLYYLAGLMVFSPLQEHQYFYGLFVEKSLPRLVGLTIDPNFASLTFIVCFYYFHFSKVSYRKVFSILSIILLLATLSRSGLLSLFLSFFFVSFFVIKPIQVFRIFLSFILFSMFVYVSLELFFAVDVSNLIEKRVEGASSGAGRFELIANAYTLFLEKPILGHGIFNFRDLNMQYFSSHKYAHNTYMELLVEVGVVGLAFFLSLLLFMTIMAFKLRKVYPFLIFSVVSLGLMAGTLSLYINSIFLFFLVVTFSLYIRGRNEC